MERAGHVKRSKFVANRSVTDEGEWARLGRAPEKTDFHVCLGWEDPPATGCVSLFTASPKAP